MARIIHESGPRAQGPFLEVNCAAIPESLLEAELFGFEAGAFTDAKRAKPGLLEAASGGILFLDEIDALPLTLQGKLLTVIEAKRVRRLGAVVEHPVDVKLIVATQAELHTRIAEGRFRADLYHRLAVVLLEVPPLRVRGEDAVLLAQHFLQRYAAAHRLAHKRLSQEAEAWLRRYAWPGNVRELGHLMERVTLLHPEPVIGPDTLAQFCLSPVQPAAPGPVRTAEEAEVGEEAAQIRQALMRTAGNVARAARLVGLSRGALRHRMARYGIALSRPESQRGAPAPEQRVGQGEGLGAPHHEGRAVQGHRASPARAPGWEPKPVAVLAIEVTWPVAIEPDALYYAHWTVRARWQQVLVEKVQGFGGVVLQQGPSLLLVAFGLPHTLEQLPYRAVQTACVIRQLTAGGHAAREGDPRPTVRQAVHWGQVLVEVGARDPTAQVLPIEETLAVPVRLLGHAAPGEILVSAPVGRLIEGWFEVQARERPVQAYRVVGFRFQRSALAMYGQRPLSRFVGRARECALLADLLGQVAEGRGHVVGLVGEAGMGKSRLVYELVHSPQTQGWRVLESAAVSYGKVIPYFPIIELLRRSAHVEERDDAHTIRAKVTEYVLRLDATLQDTIPVLLALLDVLPEDHPFLTLDASQRRQRTLDACKQVLLRHSQVQPLLLVCEDGHWADAETQALLDALIESLPRARLLLLITYRPEYQHGWGSKTYYTQVRLDPLPPVSADELLQALLGENPSLEPLKRLLIGRAEGNPFFLEESVRALVETQVLGGAPGSYRLTHPLPTMPVPATVQAVLAARLDRLPLEAKYLLQTAAVIGHDVPLALLAAIAEGAEDVLHRSLAQLQRAEFLYETRLWPDHAYTFKHALTHEVAYGSLLQERRQALHARIVEVLEMEVDDRLAEQVERLAHHALRGEVWDKALAYCRQAGEKAMTRSAYREAAGYFEQALSALAHLPETRDTREQAIDLRLDLRAALAALGAAPGRMLDHLHRAELLAQTLGDHLRLGRVYADMSVTCWVADDVARAIAYGQRALALVAALGHVGLQAWAHLTLGQVYYDMGDYPRAVESLQRNAATPQGELLSERFGAIGSVAATSRAWLSYCHAECGAFAEGLAMAEEGLRVAETVHDPFSQIEACYGISVVYRRQGDMPRALPMLERAMGLCQEWHIPLFLPRYTAALGLTYALAGRAAAGLALVEQGMEQAVARGRPRGLVLVITWLSEAYMLAGRLEEARQRAVQAVDLARQYQQRGYQAYALRLLGEIAARREPPERDQAADYYRQALILAEELGMRPLVAHCHLGLGTLYAKTGQHEQARAALLTATDLYRAMDMTFWLPQVEAACARVAHKKSWRSKR